MNSPEPLAVEVHNLRVEYDGRVVLRDVTLEVRPGEVMVIMGGSGSGKSTLLRHLLGLELPAFGRIRLLGEDLTALTSMQMLELRKKMGVAFQGGAMLGSLTVGENIMLPLREHTRLDENTMRIMMRLKLDVVNLSGCEDLMPSQLSGGMIKRASLARAIVMDPKLVFFDEPSSGLDPVVAAGLDELIIKLNEAGMSMVVVTHMLESAFKIADRIAVLGEGEMLVCGTIEEVRASKNERVQALLNRREKHEELPPEEYLKRLTTRPEART